MRLITRSLPLALLIPALACAPTRGDDPAPGDPVPQNDFQSALFTIIDNGINAQSQQANLVLTDQELDCDGLGWGGELQVWNIPAGVAWVRVFISHGVSLDGWLRDYESYAQAQASGTANGDTVSMFWGEVGEGPVEDDVPMGEPEDPPDGARDVTGSLGYGAAGMDDVLDVTLSDDELLGGRITSNAGDWSFAATKCGVWDNGGDGGEPPPDGGTGEDDGDETGSGGSGGNPGN